METDYIDIGPECFATADLTVVSYKGENYYKACNAYVAPAHGGGSMYCVKRVNHPGHIHEAYDGTLLSHIPGSGIIATTSHLIWPPHPTVPDETDFPEENLSAAGPEYILAGAHSRACGWRNHEHGIACSTNCPTCHGEAVKDASTNGKDLQE